MLWKLELVVVPVSDVDRSKAFYAEQLGFNIDVDFSPNDAFRVVQLTPPGSACSITIGKGMMDDVSPGSLKGLQMSVADIEAARAQLVDAGVDVSPVRHVGESGWQDGKGGEYNSYVFFDDPDGNSWAVQESPLVRAAEEAEAGASVPA